MPANNRKYPEEFCSEKNGKANPLYNRWGCMLARCSGKYQEKDKKVYFDRGITVCPEWHDWLTFAKWATTHGYEEHLELDRIDGSKGYSPENCRYITPEENRKNYDRDSHKKSCRAAQRKIHARPFICRETEEIFTTHTEAAEAVGVSREAIKNILKGGVGRKTCAGYTWSYLVNA